MGFLNLLNLLHFYLTPCYCGHNCFPQYVGLIAAITFVLRGTISLWKSSSFGFIRGFVKVVIVKSFEVGCFYTGASQIMSKSWFISVIHFKMWNSCRFITHRLIYFKCLFPLNCWWLWLRANENPKFRISEKYCKNVQYWRLVATHSNWLINSKHLRRFPEPLSLVQWATQSWARCQEDDALRKEGKTQGHS